MNAAEFLASRSPFLHAYATKSVTGSGWDVVLRLDGTYADKPLADELAGYFREALNDLPDVSWEKRDWWSGPPWGSR
jgi:hypothetical protein